ncbi:hypothetical protein ACIBEA_41620 [Streptomyces sp. NPDC051555]|uniref:hypothetical protein n=1 Tax=Streptomyces sp. NPDC051555 TaxID=3365657 RepID=UPI0037898D30
MLAHSAIVGVVKDVLPETQVGLLVGFRPWPLLAARMNQIRDQGGPALLGVHLARLQDDTSFKEAAGAAAARPSRGRDLELPDDPPSEPPAPASPVRVRVSGAAARSRSTTTPAAAAFGQQAPTEAAVPAHRQQAGPARGAGRTR